MPRSYMYVVPSLPMPVYICTTLLAGAFVVVVVVVGVGVNGDRSDVGLEIWDF